MPGSCAAVASRRVRVTQVLEACVGGTRKHVLELCTGLDPERFELSAVLSPLRDRDFAATTRILGNAGVRVIEFPLRRSTNPISLARAVAGLSPVLRELRPDIVHAHSAIAGFVGRNAARRAGVAGLIYTPHGFPFLMDVPAPVKTLLLIAERRLGQVTDRIICVCESEREIALKYGVAQPKCCVCIPNGIRFAPVPEVGRAQVRARLGLPEDCRLILCVGDLRRQKGHDTAVRAIKFLHGVVPDAHLLIAGEGDQRPALERLITREGLGDVVHLAGFRSDVHELLAVCDVFCQPSRWEGCPYALIEAAATGCALVATEIPGNIDVVRHGETGWLSPAEDAVGLALALRDALGDETERLRRGTAASILVRERHDMAHMLHATAALYEELATKR